MTTRAPKSRKLTLTAHVTSSVGWLGAVLVFLVIAVVAVTSDEEYVVRGAYILMDRAAWFALVPLAAVSLVTGLVSSVVTPWGVLRHYWVVAKLVITAFSTAVLIAYTRTFDLMAAVARDPAELSAVRNPSPVVHAVLALVLLVVATALAIYKPRGLTAYGWRKQQAARTPPEPSA